MVRSLILSVCLVAATIALERTSRAEEVPVRKPLSLLPMDLNSWHGTSAGDFTPEIVGILGVDEYVNRVYTRSAESVGLYVGFYRSQRQGDSIHSPLNCLPGAGWEPVSIGRLAIPLQNDASGARPGPASVPASIEVNRHIVQKGA